MVGKMRATLRAGNYFEGEILNYRKDGNEFWNELSIAPVHDENGHLVRFVSIQKDVTVRKRVEAALEHYEKRILVAQLQVEKSRLERMPRANSSQ